MQLKLQIFNTINRLTNTVQNTLQKIQIFLNLGRSKKNTNENIQLSVWKFQLSQKEFFINKKPRKKYNLLI